MTVTLGVRTLKTKLLGIPLNDRDCSTKAGRFSLLKRLPTPGAGAKEWWGACVVKGSRVRLVEEGTSHRWAKCLTTGSPACAGME